MENEHHHGKRHHDLGKQADAEPQDEHRRERDTRQPVKPHHEGIDDLGGAPIMRQSDADRCPDDGSQEKSEHGLRDRGVDVAPYLAAFEQRQESRANQAWPAAPEFIEQMPGGKFPDYEQGDDQANPPDPDRNIHSTFADTA